jgi:hypothetical protein
VSSRRSLGPPLAGWHDGFFLRDSHDYFRLYPRARLQLDFNSFFGAGVDEIAAADDGNSLKSRLFVRRARFELAGELLKRFSFNVSIEAGGQPLTNANGRIETAAGPPGKSPTADSARWAAIQSTGATALLADNWINYSICPCLNFMVGQYDAPFGLENRTPDTVSSFMESNIAIRGFAVPSRKEIGLTLWGEIGERNINYELGVFAGDGQNRPQIDNAVDFIGRIFVRPFAKKESSDALANAQIGVSMRHGERDQPYVGYIYPAITTAQGFALWDPRYRDSKDRLTHVIPSGAQNAIGGELRLPLSAFEFRGEAYYVANNTREAIEGYQLTTRERYGRIRGLGWYAQISAWPLGDAYVNGDPGFIRPVRVDLAKEPSKPKKGLEVLATVAGVHADYAGAARGGAADANTPGGAGDPAKILILQYGFGVNYWYTRHIRGTVNYVIYHTPGSASGDNLAAVPGNFQQHHKDAHLLHELGVRFAVAF